MMVHQLALLCGVDRCFPCEGQLVASSPLCVTSMNARAAPMGKQIAQSMSETRPNFYRVSRSEPYVYGLPDSPTAQERAMLPSDKYRPLNRRFHGGGYSRSRCKVTFSVPICCVLQPRKHPRRCNGCPNVRS